MKRTKKLSILISIVLISIIAISAVSATDTNDAIGATDDNDVQAIDNSEPITTTDSGDSDKLKSNNEKNIVKDSETKSFSELENDINTGGDTIELNSNYTYDETKDITINGATSTSKYTSGILIKKDCTINGNGNYIDGANKARIFVIDSHFTVTLKNIIFKNARAINGGAIYSSGKLTIQNCTFENNNANNGGAIYSKGENPIMYYIDTKDIYNEALNDASSALSKYYYFNPTQDGVDENGAIAHGTDKVIVGHSFDSAIGWPEDDITMPWLLIDMGNTGTIGINVKYDGESIWNGDNGQWWYGSDWDYSQLSIPNLCNKPEYRIKPDGSASQRMDKSKFEVIITKNGETTTITADTLSPKATLILNNVKFSSNNAILGGAIYAESSDLSIKNTEFLTDTDTSYPAEIKTITELQDQIEDLQKQVDELKSANKTLNTTVQLLEQELHKLQLANKTLNTTVQLLEQELHKLQLANKTLNETVTLQQKQIKELQENITKLQVIIDHIDDLNKLISHMDDLEKLLNNITNVTQLINNLDNITKVISDLPALNDTLNNLTQADKHIAKLESDLLALQKILNETNAKLAAIEKSITPTPTTPTPTTPTTPTTKLTLKKIKTIKKSAKKLTLSATLKIDGKAVKGKKITFRFNGKKYTRKTNAKGIAKLIIKKSILKKLKVGKKVRYQAKYGANIKTGISIVKK